VSRLDTQLETPRLLLRVQRVEDFEYFAELQQDEEACRYIGGTSQRAAAWRKFLQMPGAWALQGFGMFAVIEKESNEWVGNIGPWYPEGWPGTEVGWALRRKAWGKGYAYEAAVAAIDWAFDELHWTNVIHSIDLDNVGSQLLAQRLGSRNLGRGQLPAPFDDVVIDIWGQSREEWRARKR